MPRAPHFRDWITLFALTVFWGTSFMFNALALQSFPPVVLVTGRLIIASVTLLVFLYATGQRLPRPGKAWLSWIVVAVLGAILPMQLTAWGQLHISSAQTGVLMAISPLFVFTLAHFFLPGERLTPFRLLGFLFGFSGVVLVIGPETISDWKGNKQLLGALAALAAALSYSMNSVYARKLSAQSPLALATGMMLLAGLVTAPFGASAFDQVVWPPGTMALVAMAILGLVASAFSSVLYFRLIEGPGPSFTTLVTYLVPAWAVLAGSLVLQEDLSVNVYFGLGLILGGIAVSEFGARILRSMRAQRRTGTSGRQVRVNDTPP